MAKTEVRGAQIKDGDVKRQDLNVATTGQAVTTKVVAGTGISLSSSGVDAGTGDVTVNLDSPVSIANGGTGQTTQQNALDAITDADSATNGQVLTSNGSSASWQFLAARKLNYMPAGDFTVNPWQRGTSARPDRFQLTTTSAATFSQSKSTDAPTIVQCGARTDSYRIEVVNPDNSLASTETAYISHVIEGYDYARFAQQEFTLSFWVRSAVTGTYGVSFGNLSDRAYIATYTISSANTWEYKAITVSASPSAGDWNYVNDVGLRIYFNLGSGSNFHGTAGSWQSITATTPWTTSAQANFLGTTGNVFSLARIQLELGNVATEYSPQLQAEVLLHCQRYFEKSFAPPTAPATNLGTSGESGQGPLFVHAPVGGSSTIYGQVNFLVTKRTRLYTVTTYNVGANNAQFRNINIATDCTSTTPDNFSTRSFRIYASTPGGASVGNSYWVHWTADDETFS